MVTKTIKRYYVKDYVITQLSDILRKQYDCKYIVTINHDIVYFANTLKEAKNMIKLQYKED